MLDYEYPQKYMIVDEQYDDSYKTPVLTAGKKFIIGYTNERNGIYPASKNNPVIIFDDWTGSLKWCDFPFKLRSRVIKILKTKNSDVSLRYLYHLMMHKNFSSNDHTLLWVSKYSKFIFPIPSLSEQKRIVNILDSFTELTTELSARKKQFEYYRNQLLTFDDKNPIVNEGGGRINDLPSSNLSELYAVCKLSEIATAVSEKIDAALISETTHVGVDTLLPYKQGKKNKSKYLPSPGKMLNAYRPGDILIASINVYLQKIWLADRAGGVGNHILVIRPLNKRVLSKFLYYVLSSDSFFLYASQWAKGEIMPEINYSSTLEYLVPVPPIDIQHKIVTVLDNFDAICSDLQIGLPAEINARQKQYEYYRDQLLEFAATGKPVISVSESNRGG